jgi:hypothetical protein
MQKHIAQNGHRCAGAHDVENLLQADGKVIAINLEFHEAQVSRSKGKLAILNHQKMIGGIKDELTISLL